MRGGGGSTSWRERVTNDAGAGGEFVVVRGQTDTHHGSAAISPNGWPAVLDAIDQMVKECK